MLGIDKRVGSNFLTGRAIEALVALLSVLVISLVALTPTIARGVIAGFILLIAAASAISPARAVPASRLQGQLKGDTASRVAIATAVTVSLVAAGATVADGHGGGLDWLPASFVLAVVVAAINSWVLLVEILR